MTEHALQHRRVFTTVEVDPAPFGTLTRVPCGLATEIRGDTAYVPCPVRTYRIRPGYPRIDLWIATLYLLYGQSLEERAGYERLHGHPDRALAVERVALALAPPFGETDVPVMPVESEALVRQSVRFFENLRSSVAAREAALR